MPGPVRHEYRLHRILSREEEAALGRRIQQGDLKARDELIECNVALATWVAQRFELPDGMEREDLVQEAMIGLITAADRFDPAVARFSTYAFNWIRQHVQRAIRKQGALIREPEYVLDDRVKLMRATVELRNLLGRDPEEEEVAASLGWTVEKLGKLEAAAVVLSLNELVGEDLTETAECLISDPNVNVEGEVLRNLAVGRCKELLTQLPKKEREVILGRFQGDTLQEIGDRIGHSREGVRHIETRALRKLRAMGKEEPCE